MSKWESPLVISNRYNENGIASSVSFISWRREATRERSAESFTKREEKKKKGERKKGVLGFGQPNHIVFA